MSVGLPQGGSVEAHRALRVVLFNKLITNNENAFE